ncbi:GNAT family N-acetyltransferase [Streptomyces sp. NRRL S-87]|uniref:GNAT family N-acetyltransferase n=1 Tax=Streptomyces sp. NRRL S-87 TaxID=1463920 RepID=UPI0004C219EA|nr:GNAT family N-acetyltransferase [Streptomyces sp. NRRL S-87]
MRYHPIAADQTDRAAEYHAAGPVPAVSAAEYRAELQARQYRPEWTWFAEDEDGEFLARAVWWGRADSAYPVALDCLHVRDGAGEPAALAAELLAAGHAAFAEAGAERPPLYNILALPGDWHERPDVVAAVEWRVEAARKAGLTEENERLRLEWTAGSPVPEATGRLVFTEADDEAFLEVFRRIAVGSLDVNTRRELAAMDAERQAREDMAFYLDAPGERSWWRLAHLPDGTLAGMAIPSATPYHRNVGYLGVVPEQRGRGLIDEVLGEITRVHAAAGAERITATTDTVNVPMAAAFTRAGYRVTERRVILEAPRPA